MDPVINPFRPGAGRRPPLLAGRQPVLDAFEVVCRRAVEYGEGERAWVLNGLRGVGKTALLNELMGRVSGQGWIVAKVEASARTPLSVALSTAMRTATGGYGVSRLQRLLAVFTSFSLKVDPGGSFFLGFDFDVDAAQGVADSGRLSEDLAVLFEALGETARELRVGS